jgi:hypothetical protein
VRIARLAQGREQLVDVCPIPGFEDQLGIDLPERGFGEDPILMDVQDIGLVVGDQLEQASQAARAVADRDAQADQPMLLQE